MENTTCPDGTKNSLEDYKGEIADYNKAIEVDPKHHFAYYNRGIAKAYLKDYRGAIDDYSKVIEINPQYADAYSNRGIARELVNDHEGACRDWRKAADFGLTQPAEWVKKQC